MAHQQDFFKWKNIPLKLEFRPLAAVVKRLPSNPVIEYKRNKTKQKEKKPQTPQQKPK